MSIRRIWLILALVVYVGLAVYQLGLPGLHYDEAREAGLNAMELLTDAPVTAFRGAGIAVGGRTFPLMVQDYIGALNVYLALPFLAVSGIGVPNLRILPVLTGLLALLLIERAVSEWVCYNAELSTRPQDESSVGHGQSTGSRAPLTISGLLAITLLVASPSFVFWARQGIFVTNLMLPFVFLCLWQGVRWLRTGRSVALVAAALAAGLGLYAKLLAIWVVGPFALFVAGWWLVLRARQPDRAPPVRLGILAAAAAAFMLPLIPLIWFNLLTQGTLTNVMRNLGTSYYGVENTAVVENLAVRWVQLLQALSGEQFWYLGTTVANWTAPWLACAAIGVGLWKNWRRVLPPLTLAIGAFGASLFTLSDLFVTHYVLLQPIVIGVAAIGLGSLAENSQQVIARIETVTEPGANATNSLKHRLVLASTAAIVFVWLLLDGTASLRYHSALAQSGGLADHSDANYQLAYHLRYNGLGAPIALDWGMDAPDPLLDRRHRHTHRNLWLRLTK